MHAPTATWQINIPDEFYEAQKSLIKKAYHEAMEEAKREAGVTKTIYSADEASEILGVSRGTLNSYLKKGLRHSRIERRILIRKEAIEEFLNQHEL